MPQNTEENDLKPYIKKAIDKIAKAEKFVDYKIDMKPKFSKGENYLGVIHGVKIDGVKEDGEKKCMNLLLKVPPNNAELRKTIPLHEYYMREIYAYTVLLPTFYNLQRQFNIPNDEEFVFAKCHDTSTDDLSEFMILEDLSDQDFKMHDRLVSLDYDHVVLVIKTMAKYHALSFAAKLRYPSLYKEYDHHTFKFDFGPSFPDSLPLFMKKAVESMDNLDHKERLKSYTEDAYNILKDAYDLEEDEEYPYNIVCHGDSWNNNLLFKYKDGKPVKMIMVDWQIIRFASPVTDLAYFLFTSTDQELRSQHLEEIYNIYYETLRSRLEDLGCDVEVCYPETIYRRHLKEKLPLGLIWSLILIPLSLSNREDAMNLDDMLEEDTYSVDKLKISDRSIERMRGVVADFVKYQII